MIKRSISLIKNYKVILLPEEIDYTGIEDFDDLIYFAYLIKVNNKTINNLGLSIKEGNDIITNSILVLTTSYDKQCSTYRYLFNVWISSVFYFSPFIDLPDINEANGENVFVVINSLDFSTIIEKVGYNNKYFLGKCIFDNDLKNFEDKYSEVSKLYNGGIYNKIVQIAQEKK